MEVDNDIELQKQEDRQVPSEAYETECWGCGLRLLLPSIVPAYKCGFCGAISTSDNERKKDGWCIKCTNALDHAVVTIIIILMLLVICGGMWVVFPILFSDFSFSFYFHLVITAFLAFNTLFNYCNAALVEAGPLPQIAWGSVEFITQGALEGHRFCSVCERPKPPRAHHCRACKTCVLDMDHHCPFIGNCVGAANQRAFLLFLLFAVISSIYVVLMSVATVVKIWNNFFFYREVQRTSQNMGRAGLFVSFLQALVGSSFSSSVRALGLLYLVALSLAVTIGVGLLFYQQMKQLYDGITLVDSLQQHKNGMVRATDPRIRGWSNLKRVFGYGHPLCWMLPKLVDIQNTKIHDK